MIIRTLRTMKRLHCVFKYVRPSHCVSQRLFNRTKPIYSAQRAFCDKGHSRNGLSDSGDGVQVPQQNTTDSDLDPIRRLDTLGGSDQNLAGRQLSGDRR